MSMSSNTTFEFDVNHDEEFKLNPLTYQDGSVLNLHVFQIDFEDMVSYLKWKILRRFTTLNYMLPPNYMLSGMKQIKNDYHTNVMYDTEKVAGKLQIFVSHNPIDLSMVLILNDGSLEESFAGVISEETKIKLEESLSYLHQMQKRKNKKFDYYELLGELGQGKPIKCFDCNGLGHIARNCTQPKRQQNSNYFKDKMLLMQAQENGAVLDEEELLFLTRELVTDTIKKEQNPSKTRQNQAQNGKRGKVNSQKSTKSQT
nr:oligopeptide transporter [Tanacetum cinerariifolium]